MRVAPMRTAIHPGGIEAPDSHDPSSGYVEAGRPKPTAGLRSSGIHQKGPIPLPKFITILIALFPLTGLGLWAKDSGQPAAAPTQDAVKLRQQIDELKQTVA